MLQIFYKFVDLSVFCCEKAVKNQLREKFNLQTPIIFAIFKDILTKNPWIKNFQNQENKLSLRRLILN